MLFGRFVFAQIMEHLPWSVFHQCVTRYDGDKYVNAFTCSVNQHSTVTHFPRPTVTHLQEGGQGGSRPGNMPGEARRRRHGISGIPVTADSTVKCNTRPSSQ